MKKSLSRRQFLRNTALFGGGLMASQFLPGLRAFAQLNDLPFEVAPEARDPLGVETGVTIEGVFFEGGYGRAYIDFAADIFRTLHPDTDMTVEGIQRVGEVLRPRFIAGNPPDVIDNSGAGNLDTAALVAEGQLLDLAPLMEAPALDTPGATFAETLFPGSQDNGVYDGRQLVLHIAYTVFGIWHSASLFAERGWEYPTTWDGMLDLCETISSEGISPWTYQGRFPQYMVFGVLMPLIYKNGGIDAIIAIDNLEDGAWEAEPVVQAVEMMHQLAANNYILPGTEGLTHTEAQAEWLQGNAVFIPCGTWLENEMRALTPEGFDMVVNPVPAADEEDSNSIYASSGEIYFVPSQAAHPRGGMEFLRCLLSRESAKFFAENVGAIMPVIGGTEGIELTTAMESALAAVDAAGDDVFSYNFTTWYSDLNEATRDATGELLTNRITPAQFAETIQQTADTVKADPDIEKYTRDA
jgi:N-acetylglucosamine transport system substrate-binding protein